MAKIQILQIGTIFDVNKCNIGPILGQYLISTGVYLWKVRIKQEINIYISLCYKNTLSPYVKITIKTTLILLSFCLFTMKETFF